MTETSTIPFSDFVFAPPKASTKAAAVFSRAVAAPLSNTPEASGTARKAPSDRLLGRSSRNDSSRLASNSVVAASRCGAPAREGSSRDLPAASSGVAGLSADVSIKNAIAFRVAAASKTVSKSVSNSSIPTT